MTTALHITLTNGDRFGEFFYERRSTKFLGKSMPKHIKRVRRCTTLLNINYRKTGWIMYCEFVINSASQCSAIGVARLLIITLLQMYCFICFERFFYKYQRPIKVHKYKHAHIFVYIHICCSFYYLRQIGHWNLTMNIYVFFTLMTSLTSHRNSLQLISDTFAIVFVNFLNITQIGPYLV